MRNNATLPGARAAGRGMASLIALILLAIAAVIIVGVTTPAADRASQSLDAVDSVRAALAADAGISVVAAAAGAGSTPAIPASVSSNYSVTFVRLQSADETIRYRVEAAVASATRTVDVAHEAPESGTDVVTVEWADRPPYSDYVTYTP